MTIHKLCRDLTVTTALLFSFAPLAAQDEEAKDEEVERMDKDTANLTARTNLVNAQKAYIEALPIPGFENTTTLEGADAGSMEATMLSAEALGFAARAILEDINTQPSGGVVLLTSDEVIDLTLGQVFLREIDHIGKLLDTAEIVKNAKVDELELLGGGIGVAGALSLVTKLAGLVGNETTLSYSDADKIDDAMLVTAIADGLRGRAYIPSALFGLGEAGNDLLTDYDALQDRMPEAIIRRNALAKKKPAQLSPNDKQELPLLNQAIERFTMLKTKATTATENGDLPIHQAAKVLGVFKDGRTVLRVDVAKAGGSLINSKNIGTFFGADPLRITGGVVVSYHMFNPQSGEVTKAGVLHCATAKTSLRQLHRRQYRVAGQPCRRAS